MRRWARWTAAFVCLVLAILAGIEGSSYFSRGTSVKEEILLAAEGEANRVTTDMLLAIKNKEEQQEAPLDFTAFRELPSETVEALTGFRSTKTTVITINGSSEYLIPYGKIIQREDTEGCLLGAATAQSLFGDTKVTGLTVSYHGRQLTMRDVLEEPMDILVCQETDSNVSFSRIYLWCAGSKKEPKALAESFCSRYGINMQYLESQYLTPGKILELVPGKWSDFAGWKRNIQSWNNKKSIMKQMTKGILEIHKEENNKKGVLFSGMAVIFLLAAGWLLLKGKRMKKIDLKKAGARKAGVYIGGMLLAVGMLMGCGNKEVNTKKDQNVIQESETETQQSKVQTPDTEAEKQEAQEPQAILDKPEDATALFETTNLEGNIASVETGAVMIYPAEKTKLGEGDVKVVGISGEEGKKRVCFEEDILVEKLTMNRATESGVFVEQIEKTEIAKDSYVLFFGEENGETEFTATKAVVVIWQ